MALSVKKIVIWSLLIVVITVVVVVLVKRARSNPTSSPPTQPTTTPQNPLIPLQNRINDIISGKTSLNNLNIINSLTVQNNNPNDKGTLKLISGNSSTKNVVSFLRAGTLYNTFGVETLPSANGLPVVLSQPVSVTLETNPTISSIQKQINDIVSGNQALFNLKVNGPVTVTANQGYPIILQNENETTTSTDYYDNCILFIKNGIVGGLGASKPYQLNGKMVYDHISVASDWSVPDQEPSPTIPPCSNNITLPVLTQVNSTSIDDLNKQLDNIVNGTTPLFNLLVNGDMTISGDSNSLLIINSCNVPSDTCVVDFILGGVGTNKYGGPSGWQEYGYRSDNIFFSNTTLSQF